MMPTWQIVKTQQQKRRNYYSAVPSSVFLLFVSLNSNRTQPQNGPSVFQLGSEEFK